MANENKLQDIIQTSLENLRSMVDANTVIGQPINTSSGTTIIPVSKISVGYVSGGLDYNGKAPAAKQNFGGGGGTGLSISPVGFLTVKADGSVQMVGLDQTSPAPSGTIEQVADVIERTPDILAKIKALFSKSGKSKKNEAVDEAPAADEDTIEVEITKD